MPQRGGVPSSVAASRALEEEIALSGVLRQGRGLLELRSGLQHSTSAHQEIAACRGQRCVSLKGRRFGDRIEQPKSRLWPKRHAVRHRAVEFDNW